MRKTIKEYNEYVITNDDSTCLMYVKYDLNTGTLSAIYRDKYRDNTKDKIGTIYEYLKVDFADFAALASLPSLGKAINHLIKPKYEFKRRIYRLMNTVCDANGIC